MGVGPPMPLGLLKMSFNIVVQISLYMSCISLNWSLHVLFLLMPL